MRYVLRIVGIALSIDSMQLELDLKGKGGRRAIQLGPKAILALRAQGTPWREIARIMEVSARTCKRIALSGFAAPQLTYKTSPNDRPPAK